MLVHKLQGIHVTRQDNCIHALLSRLDRKRSYHIVSLISILFIYWNAKSLNDLANTAKLRPHRVGERGSMRLVLDKLLVTERRCRPIKRHSDIIGFDIGKRFEE